MSLRDEKLLPCPFCGCDAWMVEDRGDNGRERLLYRPQCKMCGANRGGYEYPDNAVSGWNQRALEESTDCHVCNGDCSSANPPVTGCPLKLRAEQRSPSLLPPKGWRLVPEVETEAMRRAGQDVFDTGWAAPGKVYAAMLSAAPVTKTVGGGNADPA